MAYKEQVKTVEGRKNVEIFVFALSTCGWCRKTKDLLNNLGVSYSYVDVDLLNEEDRDEAEKVLDKFNSSGFPTIIINDKIVISGFDEEKIKKVVK
jgi:glutaredoxin-like protein NrdH